ncbi:T9SS type A sorting domain-containing protein [Reichenbachiella versicolor]|uniref:T9SS type A sorting domain-containing protein n=1 Tax=Reichenbachiella versicolor TaxID=1821036 RepID=UPI0037432797
MELHPNPSSDYIFLSEMQSGESFEISNQLGIVVRKSILKNKKIDINTLPAGIYYIKTRDSISRFIKK